MCSVISLADLSVTICNVHNFGLCSADLDKITRHIKPSLDRAMANPRLHGFLFAGDWNFLGPDDHPISINTGEELDRSIASGAFAGRWGFLLKRCIDTSSSYHTHFL